MKYSIAIIIVSFYGLIFCGSWFIISKSESVIGFISNICFSLIIISLITLLITSIIKR